MGKIQILFVFILALQGCSVDKRSQLEDSIDNYVKALRRGDEAGALALVHPEKQTDYYANMQKIGDFYVSNAEVRSVFPDEKMESAIATIVLEYFPQSGSSVITQKRKFLWKYEAKAKIWLLDEAGPFGTR
jgi:hypothetical protein